MPVCTWVCRAIHWSKASLWGRSHTREENWFSLPKQPSTANSYQLRVRSSVWVLSPSLLECWLTGLVFYRQPQLLLWVHECNGCVMSRRHYFMRSSLNSDSYNPPHTFFFDILWTLRGDKDIMLCIGSSIPLAPFLCTLTYCESLCQLPSDAVRRFSDDEWELTDLEV